jgi:hypothetical protein
MRRPQSAQALRERLMATSRAASDGRVGIVVMDFEQSTVASDTDT